VARSRVELFERIRRDRCCEGLSIRELAERYRGHRRTVRQALASAVPPPRKQYPRRPRLAMEPYEAIVDGWLRADREVPRKRRHTEPGVWQRDLIAGPGRARARRSRPGRRGGTCGGMTGPSEATPRLEGETCNTHRSHRTLGQAAPVRPLSPACPVAVHITARVSAPCSMCRRRCARHPPCPL
jgi:hypothetical protein